MRASSRARRASASPSAALGSCRAAFELRELLLTAAEPLLALVHFALARARGAVARLDRLLPRGEPLCEVALALRELRFGALDAALALGELLLELLVPGRVAARLALQPFLRRLVLARRRLRLGARGLELLPLPLCLLLRLLRDELGAMELRAKRLRARWRDLGQPSSAP